MSKAGFVQGLCPRPVYPRKHQTMSPEDDKFWHWSFQEIASFDFPAMVKQVVGISGAEKIWFIGFSEGAMIAHLALTEDNDTISNHLHGIIGLGPVLSFNHAEGPWKLFSYVARHFIKLILII